MRILAAFGLLCLPLACTVNFDPGVTRFSCSDGECPNGQTCVNDICQPTTTDAAIVFDADPATCQASLHLVLSEVNLTPEPLEFIEIANPTEGVIDLTGVYITDDQDYARTPAQGACNAVEPRPVDSGPCLTSSDFIYRFPDALTIDPGAVLVIAFDPVSFEAEYGAPPDLGIADLTKIAPAGGTPSMNNAGESIVLFQWDGASDLVTDIDALVFGAPTADDDLANKTGLMIDGPDLDAVPTGYQDDAGTATKVSATGPSTSSLQRILGEGGTEGATSNGVGGEDETSEPLATHWTIAPANPGTRAFCLPE